MLELSAGYPESSPSELGPEEQQPVPFNSKGRSLFKMGGWSRSGPLGLDCSGEEMAEISRGWLMLFTWWVQEHVNYTKLTNKHNLGNMSAELL